MDSLDTAIYVLKVAAWIAAIALGGYIVVILLAGLSDGLKTRTSSRRTGTGPRPAVAPKVPSDPLLKSQHVTEDVRQRVLRAYELGLPDLVCEITKAIWRWPIELESSNSAPIRKVYGDVTAQQKPSQTDLDAAWLARQTAWLARHQGDHREEWTADDSASYKEERETERSVVVEVDLGSSHFVFRTFGRPSDMGPAIEVCVAGTKVFALETQAGVVVHSLDVYDISTKSSWLSGKWHPYSVVGFIEGPWIEDLRTFTQKLAVLERMRADASASAAPKVNKKDFGLE